MAVDSVRQLLDYVLSQDVSSSVSFQHGEVYALAYDSLAQLAYTTGGSAGVTRKLGWAAVRHSPGRLLDPDSIKWLARTTLGRGLIQRVKHSLGKA